MKKAIFFVSLAVVGGFLMTGCNQKKSDAISGEKNQPAVTEEDFVGSVDDLIMRGKPAKCTFTIKAEKMEETGTVYVSGNKIYTDTSAKLDGQDYRSQVLKLGDTQYVWNSLEPGKGVKFTFTAAEMKAIEEKGKQYAQDEKTNLDFKTSVDFKCRDFSDESVFTVPAGIEFQDMTALMKAALNPAAPAAGTGNMCGVCDQVPGEGKAQCQKMYCK